MVLQSELTMAAYLPGLIFTHSFRFQTSTIFGWYLFIISIKSVYQTLMKIFWLAHARTQDDVLVWRADYFDELP